MKRFVLFTGIILYFTACTTQPGPEIKPLKHYTVAPEGTGQKVFAGKAFPDSVGIRVTDEINYAPATNLDVEFRVLSGGGTVAKNHVTLNDKGMALTSWQAGNGSTVQELEAVLFDAAGKQLLATSLKNYAFSISKWDTVTSSPEKEIMDMATAPDDSTTLMLDYHALYARGERYFDWIRQENSPLKAPKAIEADSKGNFYIADAGGFIVKWDKQLQAWNYLDKDQDWNGGVELAVTQDDYVWLTADSQPLICSRDGGTTWSTDTTGLARQSRIADIMRMNNDSILLRTEQNTYISSDDGHTWTPFRVPEGTVELYTTPDNAIIAINGLNIYKSTDMGNQYKAHYSLPASFIYWSINIHQHQGIYYLGISGVGVLTTTNFDAFNVMFENPGFRKLFMSDDGVLTGTQLKRQAAYYYNLK